MNKTPAERLIQARKAKGYESATAAAEAHGWKEPTYLAHENGTRGIGRKVGEYAKAYGVSVGWLLNGEGLPPTRKAVSESSRRIEGLPEREDELEAKAEDIFAAMGVRLPRPKAIRLGKLMAQLAQAAPDSGETILDEMLKVIKASEFHR